ncbi:hypothetical protein [Jeotgalibacillus haloalkalitolerans]|uniref:Bacterial spore germination immunoglobulin-like domain-containing protein n=1 Tax=Jeotgalibacillus haloalkalitolerans TaxID=3104292 RepID=A0ABU5KL47_9BACL|nr:hypothetical protein [Jeotgalibacillus sp. HH7-29]MDZ5711435.1 hypothetical protein [Jeotgalibacillus sp. HH7-29]
MKKIIGLCFLILIILSGCGENNVEWEKTLADSSPEREFDILTSHSPENHYTINLREVSERMIDEKDKKISYRASALRIYSGDFGEEINHFEDYQHVEVSTVDFFKVEWRSESEAEVHIYRADQKGDSRIDDSILIKVHK